MEQFFSSIAFLNETLNISIFCFAYKILQKVFSKIVKIAILFKLKIKL